MVPVLDQNNKPLFPCKERRAKAFLSHGDAIVRWQKGIFCIKLIREETEKREEYPPVALGIDPGSKREGYTVATAKGVILNITTNTPNWVKDHLETRRMLRRSRRQRNTPCRPCRENRGSLRKNRVPHSTKSRWDAKLRIIKLLLNIIPITIINVEDIAATTKEGKKKWNISFSPLEVGKNYFYNEIANLNIPLIKTKGFDTKKHRDNRGFKKSKDKLSFDWKAHNVDSHSLCETAMGKSISPFFGNYKITFLEYHRRQLHVQNPAKGNVRKQYGTTVSFGLPRGSVVRYRNQLGYIGGSSKGTVAIHNIETGKRINQFAKLGDIKTLYITKLATIFNKGGAIPPSTKVEGILAQLR